MRVVLQRVLEAEVELESRQVSRINKGLLVYVSVGEGDGIKDAEFIADKLVNLRVFADERGRMNRSVVDVGGQMLVVSNFTLHGDCRKGRRPSFGRAAEPALAEQVYEKLCELIEQRGLVVRKGVFGEHMRVRSVNDGPVTFFLET